MYAMKLLSSAYIYPFSSSLTAKAILAKHRTSEGLNLKNAEGKALLTRTSQASQSGLLLKDNIKGELVDARSKANLCAFGSGTAILLDLDNFPLHNPSKALLITVRLQVLLFR